VANKAAIRAGYRSRRASEIGYQLLQKTTVQEAIAEPMNAKALRTGITQDKVLFDLEPVKQDAMSKTIGKDGNALMASHAAALRGSGTARAASGYVEGPAGRDWRGGQQPMPSDSVRQSRARTNP